MNIFKINLKFGEVLSYSFNISWIFIHIFIILILNFTCNKIKETKVKFSKILSSIIKWLCALKKKQKYGIVLCIKKNSHNKFEIRIKLICVIPFYGNTVKFTLLKTYPIEFYVISHNWYHNHMISFEAIP